MYMNFVSSGGWLPPLLDSFSQKSLSTADASAPTQGEADNQMCHKSFKSSQLTFHQEMRSNSFSSSHILSVRHILLLIQCVKFII